MVLCYKNDCKKIKERKSGDKSTNISVAPSHNYWIGRSQLTQPIAQNDVMVDDRSCNGHSSAAPSAPSCNLSNGSKTAPQQEGGPARTIHDGFATIRAGGGKRARARSSSSLATSGSVDVRPKTCPGCCGGSVTASTPVGGAPLMEPLWEEKNGGIEGKSSNTVVPRRDSKIPWWEVATRRSRYRSCPAFSQASIVSALEQTVSDVTDRLERLASSPDLNISEADELRRSAAILRRQSSAVSQSVSSGYFSLERQASCDSVSSVNSSVSNATHVSFNSMGQSRLASVPQHSAVDKITNENTISHAQEVSKIKKKSWLRTSIRRAFGRNVRKRDKLNVTSPPNSTNWDSVSTSSRDAPQQHYHSCHSLIRNRPLPIIEPCKEHRNLIKDSSTNSEIVSRLQRLLQDKERILTENKLELSSVQKTVKSQDELIARLQTEATALKEENLRLNTLVQNKFGSVSDSSMATPIEATTISVSNANGIYATLNLSKGKKVKLCVVENTNIESPKQVANKNLDSPGPMTLVGTLNIQPKTSWKELDDLVADKCMEFSNRLDPGNGLGLGRESVLCYRVAEALRAKSLPKPDLLPYGYCVGNIQGIHVWLKGPLQKDSCYPMGNVSSVCFEHGIPSSTIKGLLPLLQETRRVILVGPESCGKSNVALQLARCYVASKGGSLDSHNIVSFTVNGSNSLELCQLLASVASRSRILSGSQMSLANEDSSLGTPPQILVINDLHAANGVVETIQRCLPSSALKGPAIIATSQNAPILVTRLQVHCSFRWMGFSVQEEPIRGALGRLLRRPVLAAEISSGMNLADVHRTVDWLTRLWLNLNSHLAADRALGPLLLHDCPLDQEEAKNWFILKWNQTLAPFLVDLISADPKTWVLSTNPWNLDPNDLIGLNQIRSQSSLKNSSSPAISTTSTKRSFQQKRFYETSFDGVDDIMMSLKAEPEDSSDGTESPLSSAGSSSSPELTTNGYQIKSNSAMTDEAIYAKPLLNNGTSAIVPAVEKVIYTKPPPSINNKVSVLGSFSTFISNDNNRDASRKYSIQSITPVMYRRNKVQETNLDQESYQNGFKEELSNNNNRIGESLVPSNLVQTTPLAF